MAHPAIRRLRQDIHRLHQAQRERKQDARALRKDVRELKADRRELQRDRDVFEKHHKELQRDRKALGALRETREERLAPLLKERASLQEQYDASIDPLTGEGDPLLKSQLDAVIAKETQLRANLGAKIDARRQEVEKGANAVQADRKEIKEDRREISHDRRDIKQGRKELARDVDRVKNARRRALEHLRPAEYQMGLKQTNRVRKELGLKPVDHVIRPINLNTVKGCAQFLLKSDNVSFWSGLSTGSDRKNLERLARTGKAFVPATGQWITPKLSMMKALVEMAKKGRIQINALTGGIHSSNSNHYRGTAVDLEVTVGSPGQIEAIANKYGGRRNWETTHIHLDF